MQALLLTVDRYVDPFFGLNIVELFLGLIVICVFCAVVAWAWRTFHP